MRCFAVNGIRQKRADEKVYLPDWFSWVAPLGMWFVGSCYFAYQSSVMCFKPS